MTVPAAPTSPIKLAQKAEAVKGAKPSGFDPELFVMEPKFDGWRVLVYVAEDGVHLFSHTGACHDKKWPRLEEDFAGVAPGTWIDGEAVCFVVDDDFKLHEWASVQKVLGASVEKAKYLSHVLTFVAFDLISHAGIDARSLPFSRRRELLEGLFAKHTFEKAKVMLTPQMAPTDDALADLVAGGWEGAVVKSLNAPYASGARGAGQIKIKPQETDDFIVVGYKPGESGFTGLVGAIVFGAYDDDGKLVEVGRCSGMDMETRIALTKDPVSYLGAVFECAHFGMMKEGYRSPQWKRWRTDKDAAECRV